MGEKVKAMSKRKYHQIELHKQNVNAMAKRKYCGNSEHKKCATAGNKL